MQGSGSSSESVFEVCQPNNLERRALKIYKSQTQLQHELKMTNALAGLPTVPKLVPCDAKSSFVLPCVFETKLLRPKHLASVVAALKPIHEKKICHRDLRGQNILVGVDDKVLLIDWEKAVKIGDPVIGGDYRFSSAEYLDFLSNQNKNLYQATCQDDLQMIVRVAHSLCHPHRDAIIVRGHPSIKEVATHWQTALSNILWAPLVKLAAALEYDQLAEMLKELGD
jgi:thiamine kinase-like enzyme